MGWALRMATIVAVGTMAAAPVSAQFFMKSKDLAGGPVSGSDADLGQWLPGATPAEIEAALIWNMRAALNVAALQCQFEPTLLTVPTYNALLNDHRAELKTSFDTLTKYFARVNKTAKAGQTALDQFGTRTYSSFATVAAQYNFCQTAHAIGRDVLFQPRGELAGLVRERTRELRNSLVPWGEQALAYAVRPQPLLPRLDAVCWNKKGEWNDRKCGAQTMVPVRIGVAQR